MKLLETTSTEEIMAELSILFKKIDAQKVEIESRKKNVLEDLIILRNLISHFQGRSANEEE